MSKHITSKCEVKARKRYNEFRRSVLPRFRGRVKRWDLVMSGKDGWEKTPAGILCLRYRPAFTNTGWLRHAHVTIRYWGACPNWIRKIQLIDWPRKVSRTA